MAKKATKKRVSKTARKATTKKKSAARKKPVDGAALETPTKKKTKKRVSKGNTGVRLRLCWGVFNQQMKRVALFEFNERKAAEEEAKELCKAGRPHFVQKVKEEVTDDPIDAGIEVPKKATRKTPSKKTTVINASKRKTSTKTAKKTQKTAKRTKKKQKTKKS